MKQFKTTPERSRLMAKIRGDKLRPETNVSRALRRLRVKARRNCANLPGTPDFVLDSIGVVIFVHGCFWHGCQRHYREPKSNAWFWKEKLAGNRRRDERCCRRLRRMGWSVYTIWEHDAKTPEAALASVMGKLTRYGRTLPAPRRS